MFSMTGINRIYIIKIKSVRPPPTAEFFFSYGLAYKYATIRAIRLYRPDATKHARRVQQFADVISYK